MITLIYKPSFRNLLPTYFICIFFCFLGIQSVRAGLAPPAYFLILWGTGGFIYTAFYQKYRVEIRENELYIHRLVFPVLIIPWIDIHEIQYKRPIFQTKRIFLKYKNKDKTREIYFFKCFFSRADLIQEISNRTNIPLPERYIKFREKLKRNYRRNEILWGILLIPVSFLAGFNYWDSIPYGISMKNEIWYLGLYFLSLYIISYLVIQFDYHPTPKRETQTWCYMIAITSTISFPNLLIYFIDSGTYYGYGILFIGVFFFNLLLFVPDSRYQHRYIVPIFLICGLSVWQVPMLLIPGAPTQELNFQKSFVDYSFTPDGSLCHYSNQSIYFYHPENGKEESYPFLQETTGSYNFYYTHWSPDNQKFVYQSFDDQGTTQSMYIFNYPTKQYRKIYYQQNTTINLRYNSRFIASSYNWSPDSKYFIFASPLFSQSTIPPEYDVMVYDSNQSTTRNIIRIKELMTDIWWTQDTTLYYLTYQVKKPRKGAKYFTLWKGYPVYSTTSQLVSIQASKEYEFNTPLETVQPLFKGNYLYIQETINNDYKCYQYLYSLNQKKKISFSNQLIYYRTPLENKSHHPLEDKFLYTGYIGKKGILCEFDLNTGKSKEIIRENELIEEPCYSFDAKRIAYAATDGFFSSLISIKSDGTDWRKVSPTIMPEINYSSIPIHCWSPKDNFLYVGLMTIRMMNEENRFKSYLVNLNDKK
jgi:hypothetical protein